MRRTISIAFLLLFPVLAQQQSMTFSDPAFMGRTMRTVAAGGGGSSLVFVGSTMSTWNNDMDSAVPISTTNIAVLAGDVLVGYAMAADSVSTVIPSGGSLTWATNTTATATDYCMIQLFTATVDSNKTMAFTVQHANDPGFTFFYGCGMFVFRNSSGVGTGVKATDSTGDAVVSLTTTTANSIIVSLAADYNAADGASRVWATINSVTPTAANGLERLYHRNTTYYTLYGGYWTNSGVAEAKTVGITAPDGAAFTVVAVEIKP